MSEEEAGSPETSDSGLELRAPLPHPFAPPRLLAWRTVGMHRGPEKHSGFSGKHFLKFKATAFL